MLSTDYALVRLLIWALAKPTRSLGRGVLQVGAAYAQKLNSAVPTSTISTTPRTTASLAVRMSGRPADD